VIRLRQGSGAASALDVVAARRRIRGHVRQTPLHDSAWLSEPAGTRVALKLENVQVTGSFKVRGALNALITIHDSGRPDDRREIVTASAGNHGRAIAYAAEMLGLPAVVFTPRDAPDAKVAAIRRHGARLEQVPTYDEAERAAKEYAASTGATFISPYNDRDVIAGAGTIALEILEAWPDIATLVVPVGGGGLIAGIALAARAIMPRMRIIGVEAQASTAFGTSLRAGGITTIQPQPTIADGLAGNVDPESITFEMVRTLVDEMIAVTEEELFDAMRGLVREEHLIAEGAGAAATAAVLSGKARGHHMVAIVSGGNIDAARLIDVLATEDHEG
jgi:threonine dehydratase